MKTFRFIISLAVWGSAGTALAQPILTHDRHGISATLSDQVQTVGYVSPGTAGAGQHWDFRSLSPLDLPLATTVGVDALGRLAVHEGETVFYFEPSGNANLYSGFESPGKTVVYDRSVAKLHFPFAFGNAFTEVYTANGLFIADTIATRLEGSYTVAADAYGSLVLPDGRTFEQALRIKTIDRYREYLCDTTETLIEKYLWYTPEHPFPVFTAIQAISGYTGSALRDTVQTACYALVPAIDPVENAPESGNENKDGQGGTDKHEPLITLYPNPAVNFIEVHSEVELLQYQLRSVMGVLYKSQKVSRQEKPLRIPLINTSPGWYILNLETANGWLVRRFVIQ